MTDKTEKNKGGRPPVVLTADQIAQVEAMAGFLSLEVIADFLEIDANTFRAICDRQPEVFQSYKKGRARAFGGVGKGLLQRALEGDNTAAIFYAKTQMGWKETQVQEHKEHKPANSMQELFGNVD